MSNIQEKHTAAMDLAEAAFLAKLKGDSEQALQLTRQAFESEQAAAALIAHQLDAEPTRSVLHRSAANLAVNCGELQAAERLIATALTGNPPTEIAEELKDLFIQINLRPYLQRHGISVDNEQINAIIKRAS
ncbi:hypothetical protein G7B40_025715 [Aetokthonos hydrillicola Thurmond2011]|jgi:hypothetical protein|uniref:Uncharacterized protein n=2 Tax=Aetokthonos TaxID=1550243 RepID=A0AAP5MC65_9CYAN|nr:hypothetical protein [Aetokthonos hydrillicola]MBO3460687.1 hypothetical protein [Aetokthonos hydrillicola CCALA 1050]MBW4587685.1 hypothetical protein [Aetokthonos hydrillicola CCALA 1050]MDR9897933.1 hypothetical protein [Aetokthonos hydrillicola Thurmond2011]